MKAIIIAAGKGSRLEHHTVERPKCMVSVGGKTILETQLHALNLHGLSDLHIIRGYLADRLVVDGATYHLNTNFENNNILFSLFYAQSAMNGPFVSSYSDIVYTPAVVEKLMKTEGDICLVVDRDWASAYVGREDHPVEQAELAEVVDGKIVKVGKQVGAENALGEFIGLAKFSAKGAEIMNEVFNDVRSKLGDDEPFHAAKLFRKSYLTDLFLEIIKRGYDITPVLIDGEWREIDTVQDLERVNQEWT